MIDRLGMTLIVLGFALAVPALAGGGEDFRLVEEWGDGMCCRDRGTVIPPTIPGCGDTIGDCMPSGCATTAYEPPVLEDPYNPLADAHCEDTDKDAKCDARKGRSSGFSATRAFLGVRWSGFVGAIIP